MQLEVNGVVHELDVEDEMPLLWVLREELGLRGTKFGCGLGQCGACTVHVGGRALRSCITPAVAAVGAPVRTIEDLGAPEDPHPLQREWLAKAVPQCGYCQPGMIMAAAAFLETHRREASEGLEDPESATPPPTDEAVRRAVTNICRCGCYERIRQAIVAAGTT